MQPYQQQFIEIAIAQKALCFGEYTLKSGRVSPYFFNAGLMYSGRALAQLARCYAHAIVEAGVEYDVLFGPAYKGIPLAAATVCSLADDFNLDIPYAYNRKEVKNHGEGGQLVGAPLTGRIMIIDDVITAGTAVREVMEMITVAGARPAAVVIGLNRQERGAGDKSAIQEVEQAFGIPVISIVNLNQLISYLSTLSAYTEEVKKMEAYRELYGV